MRGVSMNRIDSRFALLRQQGRKALITYITAGDPDLETTRRCVLAMAASGADVVELGIPFSDPLADGPVIQQAVQRALSGGFRLRQAFELVAALRQDTQLPLVFMTYFNPVMQYGAERFAGDAAQAGVDGLIIPDMPVEESEPMLAFCNRVGLHLIPLVAPTTTDERLRRIAASAGGFIYCVSLTGVTGEREKLSERLFGLIERLRPLTSLPLAAGFGISTPEQARDAARVADGVIVGSALVRLIGQGGTPREAAGRVAHLTRRLREAIDGVIDGFGEREGVQRAGLV